MKAEAERQSTIAAGQADAEQQRLIGEGERSRRTALAEAGGRSRGLKTGEAERARRTAIAEAIRLEGDAEASAIAAGQRRGRGHRRQGQGVRDFSQAAVLDLVIKVLPQVVREASAPARQRRQADRDQHRRRERPHPHRRAQRGAGLQIGSDLTGTDLKGLIAGLAGGALAPPAPAVVAAPARAPKRGGGKPTPAQNGEVLAPADGS
jgi:flotillin